MTLGHSNRIRRTGGNFQVCELEIAEALEPAEISSGAARVERHAYGIYPDADVAFGERAAERRQPKSEPQTGNAFSELPRVRRSCSESESASNIRGQSGSGS